ncbi:hypothetical protein [Lentzea flava]|uniref:Uncharacterized protein n=1 Tax=Lentzea flava TaxID=103732 RepID=A0ABQ2VH78_9PSEU|nr:hypothetical protein [Lentzea flava]MCP2205407.1 hypothetical protein [Lentzea flava]GGU86219.1 hypothetical protein GCM10010178_90320 [Lentzea flava]
MNRRAQICLLAAATLAACGQPAVTPRALPQDDITTKTTTTTSASTTTPTTAEVIITQPPPPPPRPTTKTTVKPPPPPPPKPRWVFPASLRGSIEQRTGQSFPSAWASMQTELANVCPGKKVCVGFALVVDTSTNTPGDCIVVPKGIKVPDPLYEGGAITFRVTNKRCSEG